MRLGHVMKSPCLTQPFLFQKRGSEKHTFVFVYSKTKAKDIIFYLIISLSEEILCAPELVQGSMQMLQ